MSGLKNVLVFYFWLETKNHMKGSIDFNAIQISVLYLHAKCGDLAEKKQSIGIEAGFFYWLRIGAGPLDRYDSDSYV